MKLENKIGVFFAIVGLIAFIVLMVSSFILKNKIEERQSVSILSDSASFKTMLKKIRHKYTDTNTYRHPSVIAFGDSVNNELKQITNFYDNKFDSIKKAERGERDKIYKQLKNSIDVVKKELYPQIDSLHDIMEKYFELQLERDSLSFINITKTIDKKFKLQSKLDSILLEKNIEYDILITDLNYKYEVIKNDLYHNYKIKKYRCYNSAQIERVLMIYKLRQRN